jgi:pantetheine-phosphate adenylyltransferase
MALMNKKLDPGCETVYLMPSEQYTYLNSSVIREIAALGGSVSEFVPQAVEARLRKKLGAPHAPIQPLGKAVAQPKKTKSRSKKS